MSIAARSYLTAGLALAGAAAVVTPIGGAGVSERASTAAYSLTAASTAITGGSLSNVPVNLFNMAMSVPAWEIQAMGRLADAMVATGSWQVWGPTNVFGFDEQDPPKLTAIIDMLVPIQPFSSVLGAQLSWWAQANLPMNAGCAAAQNACPDPAAMLNSMFTVPVAELSQGYQFPVVTNPYSGQETSWSGRQVKLDPGGAFASLQGYLTAPPVGIESVSAADAFATISRLGKSIADAFYPFVQNSQWFDDQNTILAPLFRSLAPALCASCDPTNPYDNEWLNNYSPKPAAVVDAPGSVAALPAPAAAAVDPGLPETATTPAIERAIERVPDVPDVADIPSDPGVGRHRAAGGEDARAVGARSRGRAAQASDRGLTSRSSRVS